MCLALVKGECHQNLNKVSQFYDKNAFHNVGISLNVFFFFLFNQKVKILKNVWNHLLNFLIKLMK